MPLRREDAVRELQPVFPTLVRSAEVGAHQARQHFCDHKLDFEPCAHATVFRMHARQYLKGRVSLQPLANNGICVVVSTFKVRFFKQGEDILPPYPLSPGRHEYMRQYLPTLAPDVPTHTDVVHPMYRNLCLYWSVDDGLNLCDVRLVYTEGSVTNADQIKVLWEYPLNDIIGSLEVDESRASDEDELVDEYTLPGAFRRSAENDA